MRNLERMFHDMISEILDRAGDKYGFNASDAKRELLDIKLNVKEKDQKKKVYKREQPKCALPFTGVVREDCCYGVKYNHGLYSQCWNEKEEGELCKSCGKESKKKGSGEPELGLIVARVLKGEDWRDNKGRVPVHYSRVMKKQKLSRDQVMEEAAKFNINVTEEHFEAPEVKRGRPKKELSDTESEKSTKRPRGRPKKESKVVEVDATEDLFASLMVEANKVKVADEDAMSEISDVSEKINIKEVCEKEAAKEKDKDAAKAAKEAAKAAKEKDKEAAKAAKEAAKAAKEKDKEATKAVKEAAKAVKKAAKAVKLEKEAAKLEVVKKEDGILEVEEESDEEAVVVKKFTHNGETYLKSNKNVLYNIKTQEPIGLWNDKTNSIEECELESDEEEDE
jgi:regulator of protease activity HflC (stomatin/prohibitin superfamily)